MASAVAAPGVVRSTVLVVDDVPENLEVVGGLLRPDYHVKVANSGPRALHAARTEPVPDLILLDIMMPVMDGYAVLEALRADPVTRDIPVIFVTAMDGDEKEQLGLALGAVDYIAKPIRPAILQARVRNQLELKQARDWLRDQNGYLEREVQRRMRENEVVKEVSLHALAALAEARDSDTGNHIVRTQYYVEALGRQLLRSHQYVDQLAGGRLERIARAAPLHDVGKVGIPDHVLLKPGRLTTEEYEVMKDHARIGADAIAEAIERVAREPQLHEGAGAEALEFLRIAAEIAAAHHEKWDGTGYPRGLAGEQIPLSARMMALADVFDALSCRRVYKKAVPYEEIVNIIRDGRGRHFDPAVVDAFFEVEAEFHEISLRYADAH
jgi:putative two-component system response regulator